MRRLMRAHGAPWNGSHETHHETPSSLMEPYEASHGGSRDLMGRLMSCTNNVTVNFIIETFVVGQS